MFSLKVHALEHPSKEALDAMLSSDVNTADDGSTHNQPATTGSGSKDGGTASNDATPTDDAITKTINFSSGNPRVEATRGVMHLYRDTASEPGSLEKLPDGRSERLCVLAVPNHMTGSDFCQFTGAFIENIKEMRFVRNDGQTDRYSVLMTFDSQQFADDFYQHYNLKPFSSLEAELCHVLFTADVLFTETAEQASTPPSGLTELPTCPVCLERLDQQISGILTTVCNHSFHSACISKWTDSSCPVCRYCQQQSENSTCFVCGSSENLWICVICGFVGCGRYKEGHAVNHWKESQHCYSLDLETQRVWDYVGDGYVHRLIQSKTDGKLVEMAAPCRDGSDDCCNCGTDNQGMESALYHSKVDADFERDVKSDQRHFGRRDAADLFCGSALANDKDGNLTEREMSWPSVFFTRGVVEDSAHAVIDLSDTGSEVAQVNHRANRSVSVSGPLGSDRSVGSESETYRDSTISLGNFATEDLDLVENAILRLNWEEGRLSSKQHNEDSTKLKDVLGLDEHLEGSEKTQSSAGSVELQLLSRLLDQVQTLREQKYHNREIGRAARSLSRGRSVWDITKRGGKEKRVSKDDLKKAVEAATQAAKSASEAAQNASTLVTKNSEAMGKLLQSINPSASKRSSTKKEKKLSLDNLGHSESSSDSEESSASDDVKDIAKKIVSQNRYTHVVLGMMLVSSFVWRYIVVKVAKRVKNKVSDPWGYVGGMFKGPEKEKVDSVEEESSGGGLNLPKVSLPAILHAEQGDQKEVPTRDMEERVHKFGNMLQCKSSSRH